MKKRNNDFKIFKTCLSFLSELTVKRIAITFFYFIIFSLFSFAEGHQLPVYKLKQMVVTASRIPSTLSSVDRSIIIITQDEIENANVESVQDLLEFISGVDLRRRGPYGIQADLSIRGGTFEQSLVLIDGIKINDSQTGHYNLDIPLQLDDIKRIEILKGQASRLYGPNAFGGVINIITRNYEGKKVGLNVHTGENRLLNTGLLFSYPIGNIKNYFSVSKRSSDGYRHNTDFDVYNGYYRLNTNLGFGEANMSIGYIDKKFGANNFYSDRFPNQREHTKSGLFQAGLKLANASISFSPKVYWRNQVDDFILNYKDPEWYHNHHEKNEYGFEFQSIFDSQWGSSAFGAELGNDEIKSNNLGNHSRIKGGFFFEHRFEPVENLSLTLGANSYYYSDWGWNVWPGIDMSFMFTESLKAYGSIGRSFRVPTYTELYYNSPVNKGNPNLQPEKAWSFETGLKWNHKQLNIDLAMFRREGNNLIDWVRVDINSPWEARNIARVNTNGFEIAFQFIPINFPIKRVKLGYTFINSDKKIKNFESKYVLNNLRHQLVFGLENLLFFKLRQNWKLRFEDRITGENYIICDTQINRKFKNLNIFLKVTNLFNTAYTEVGGIPMPGRWIVAGFKLNIGNNK